MRRRGASTGKSDLYSEVKDKPAEKSNLYCCSLQSPDKTGVIEYRSGESYDGVAALLLGDAVLVNADVTGFDFKQD